MRQQQLQELEKIRLLFAQNSISFSEHAFERGLLIPEDRPVLACVQNLPLPGSQLLRNPIVDVRAKKRVTKKKTKKNGGVKKKKKKKDGSKTPKSSRAKQRT